MDDRISEKIFFQIQNAKDRYLKKRKSTWDETDVVLITYADQFTEKELPALITFKKMFDKYFSKTFNIVHLLPFYPFTSDDGFSVINYQSVDSKNGDWQDVRRLSKSTRLMFDFVCNHISCKSKWFQAYLNEDPNFQNFFIEGDPNADYSNVIRPRATPLLTEFHTKAGKIKHVWTTFSSDQIDLNYRNPNVLVNMIDILLFYIEQGAEYIRLDAAGFLWKELGTSCMNLEKTHQLIKLFRQIIDTVASGTVVITETNVPYKENISYFGNGTDEAHMIYQFPLPPLLLYSILFEDASAISKWAKGIDLGNKNKITYYNFLASHDGIGLNPIRGIIPENQIKLMINRLREEGALISYKSNPDKSQSPYEINSTFMNALSKREDSEEIHLRKFLLAHSVLLGLPGVPAIYIQSILGSTNDYQGVRDTNSKRAINRQKYELLAIDHELSDGKSFRNLVYTHLSKMISIRKEEPLFHPNNSIHIFNIDKRLFAFQRFDKENRHLLFIHNMSGDEVFVDLKRNYFDLFTKDYLSKAFKVKPYQFFWLKEEENS